MTPDSAVVLSALTCPLCLEVFKTVLETPCCSQGYCTTCLTSVFRGSSSGPCPTCRAYISLADCRSNAMVQRMVDALPAKCPHKKCDASLTRGIVDEHTSRCPFAPVQCPNGPACGLFERRALDLHLAMCPFREHPHCPVHQLERSLHCELDGEMVCPKCYLLGPHRYHRCLPWSSLRTATLQSTAVAIATAIPTSSSAGYWLDITREKLAAIELELGHPHDPLAQPPSSSSSPTAPEVEAWDLHHTPTLYALVTLLSEGDPARMESAIVALGAVPDRALIDHFARAAGFGHSAAGQGQPHQRQQQAQKQQHYLSASVVSSQAQSAAELQREMESFQQNFKELFDFVGLKVQATPLVGHVKGGEVNRMHLLFDMLSGKRDEQLPTKRPPFSLMIVLDRSGSMSGSKIEMCKLAVKACLQRLGPEDLLHLVIYDDSADTVFSNGTFATRESLYPLVDGVTARGGTDIACGLERGFQVVTSLPDAANYTKRIFLFSDGVATTRQGEILPLATQFKEASIFTSSFGIGADFDERMMKGVSDCGGGNYFFISTSESIAGLVEKGMKGVERILATDAVLRITGCQGQPVSKVGGEPGESVFRFGDVRENGMKQVLVELDWDGMTQQQQQQQQQQQVPLVNYELQFKLHGVEPMTLSGTVWVQVTDGWAVFEGDFNPTVEVQLAIHEVSVLDKLGLKAAERGNIRDALHFKSGSRDLLERARPKDRIGFVTALLVRCTQRIEELQKAMNQSGRMTAMLQKELHNDHMYEECDDMGFGLFD